LLGDPHIRRGVSKHIVATGAEQDTVLGAITVVV
jgi:hypothetical protein